MPQNSLDSALKIASWNNNNNNTQYPGFEFEADCACEMLSIFPL